MNYSDYTDNWDNYRFELNHKTNIIEMLHYGETVVSTLKLSDIEHEHAWEVHPLISNYKICKECEQDTYNQLSTEEKVQLIGLKRFQRHFNNSELEEKKQTATQCYAYTST